MSVSMEREFEVFKRGEIRDLILDHFRSGCKGLVNPETGSLFTEDEIAAATAEGTRYWIEATAIDDMAQSDQRKALFLSDQLQIDRACSEWLKNYHAPQWDPDGKLKATPGSGRVLVSGLPLTMIIGSTQIPDETAYWGRTSQGVRVQVFQTVAIPSDAQSIDVVMVAMDVGANTNLAHDEVIEWVNRDPSMSPQATVIESFTGGTNEETDAAQVSRMMGSIRHKQGGGNDAQQRAWARASSNAVEDAFVYGCAFGYGSFLVVPVQKRVSSSDKDNNPPYARIPNVAVQAAVTARVVPPGSPENPSPPRGIVLPPRLQPTNLDIRISLEKGSTAGWEDFSPWPNISDGPPSTRCTIDAYIGENAVVLHAPGSATLPGVPYGSTVTGSNCPKMMFWYAEKSTWVPMDHVVSVQQIGAVDYQITFTTRPATISLGAVVSPSAVKAVRNIISRTVVKYMDSRGPGELFNLETHYLGNRCVRFPEQSEVYPSRVGSEVASRITKMLFGIASDASLIYASRTTPDIPSNPILGPNMLSLGTVGIYPL
jgi:hypothetical protein